jgi:tetratricopeptide (TPR) repeat protein
MAQSMCEPIQNSLAAHGGEAQSDLKEQVERLLRMFHHHRGELSLHTNQPRISLSSYRTFIKMLNAKLGDAPCGKDQSLGVAWDELGCAWLQSDKPGEAEPCFQKSIEALGALEGATRISISLPLINIAFAYWLQGRLEEAASTFQEALEDREREFGVNDWTSFV